MQEEDEILYKKLDKLTTFMVTVGMLIVGAALLFPILFLIAILSGGVFSPVAW